MTNSENPEAPAVITEPPKPESVQLAAAHVSPSYAWVTQPLILAGCSVVSYLYAYLYEAGFCAHFGIPPEFIKIDTVRLLIVIVSLFSVVYVLSNFYTLTFRFMLETATPRKQKLLRVILFVLFLGLLVWQCVELACAYFILILLGYIMYSDIFTGKRYRKPTDGKLPETVESLLSPKIGEWTVNVLGYVCLLGLAFSLLGSAKAATLRDFLTPESRTDTVVLKIYGDTMICAKAHFAKHKIYPVFSIYLTTSEFSKSLTLRHFTKMHVADDLKRK